MPARGAAEHLTVLVDYSQGILARLHRQIHLYRDAATRPPFLQAKEMDAVIKGVIKKFPVIEQPKQGQASPMFLQREAIQTQLGDAYYLLVDLYDFHYNVCQLMQNLSEQQFTFDANLLIQVTQQFFQLLCNYTAAIELLSRYDDRRIVAGCFQCSYEMLQGVGEPSFAQVGKFIADFEHPWKTLPLVFEGHKKLIGDAVMSLKPVFDVRYLTPAMLRKDSPYNISSKPHTMAVPTALPELAAELIPIDSMVQWICVAFCLVPGALVGNAAGQDLLERALADGYMLPVHREQTLNVFKALEGALSSGPGAVKELKKPGKALLDRANAVNLESGQFHAERRQFLRGALRELHLLVADKPGLLGPKCSTVFAALSFARGEIEWLFRHKFAPEKLSAKKKMDPAWLNDPGLAELMFWASMLRRDVMENAPLMQRYFVEFLGLDAKELHQMMAQGNFGDYEQKIFSSFYEIADKCSGEVNIPDGKLDGIRLDLRRLSSGMCVASSANTLDKNRQLALQLSAIHFHTSVIDNLEGSVLRYSSLHGLFFYREEFIKMFEETIKSGQQDRFLVAFAEYCVTFPTAASKDVPTEFTLFCKESANVAHHVLTRVAQQAVGLVNHVAKAMSGIDAKVLPSEAVEALAVRMEAKGKSAKHRVAEIDQSRPGSESQALGDATVVGLRELQEHLADVCWTLNAFPAIIVGNIRLAPQEYMTELMEQSFAQALVGMLRGPRENVPARPSVVLQSVTTYMGVLRHVEGHINIDIISLFQEGLLQQTLFKVGGKGMTLATRFIQFYLNLVLKLVPAGGIVVSTSRKALCHVGGEADLGFKAQEYTDILELQALVSLIGAFGTKQLSDHLMSAVSQAAIEMKRLVTESKTELDIIRSKTHLPDQCLLAFGRIRGMAEFIHHSKVVGAILSFRQLLAEASQAVFSKRIPYIYKNIEDWHSHVNTGAALNSLAFAAGIKSRADPFLIHAFRPLCANPEADYSTWSLYMVMNACALKALAYDPTTVFKAEYDAHENNAHCVATTVNEISAAVFTLTAVDAASVEATIVDAQTQFLRVASVLLIRLGSEGPTKQDRDGPLARNAVYVILDRLVKLSPYVSADVLEEHFPYSLIRTSLHECYRTLDGR